MADSDSTSEPIPSGTIIAGGYEVLRSLEAEFGYRAYLCKDSKANGREVEVRILGDEIILNRAIMANLTRVWRGTLIVNNPHILGMLDVKREQKTVLFVSAPAGGSSLKSLVDHNQALRITEVVQILMGACAGLAAIHQTDQVHGDLQPEHIVITSQGEIRVAGFGLGPLLSARLQHIMSSGKSPDALDFVPPEYFEHRPITTSGDIYALGVIAYRLITGRSPYAGQTIDSRLAEKKTASPTPPHHLVTDCPDKLSAIIMRMITSNLAIRFNSVWEIFTELQPIAGEKAKKFSLPEPTNLRRLKLIDLPLFWVQSYAAPSLAAEFELLEPALRKLQALPAVLRIISGMLLALLVASAIALLGSQGPSKVTSAAPDSQSDIAAPTGELDTEEDLSEPLTVPAVVTAHPSDYPGEFTVGLPTSLSGQVYFSADLMLNKKIISYDLTTRRISKIVDDEFDNSEPAISPDLKLIAFTSVRNGTPQLFLRDLAGGQATQVGNFPRGVRNPSWSPDGASVVFAVEIDPIQKNYDAPIELFAANADGSNIRQLTRLGGRNLFPKWSPDGKTISYSTDRFWPGSDICLFTLSIEKEECIRSGSISYTRAHWIPGQAELQILDTITQSGASRFEIYSLTSGRVRPFSTTESNLIDAAPSPDGKLILAVRPPTNDGLYILSAFDESGTDYTLLTSDRVLRAPIWVGK